MLVLLLVLLLPVPVGAALHSRLLHGRWGRWDIVVNVVIAAVHVLAAVIDNYSLGVYTVLLLLLWLLLLLHLWREWMLLELQLIYLLLRLLQLLLLHLHLLLLLLPFLLLHVQLLRGQAVVVNQASPISIPISNSNRRLGAFTTPASTASPTYSE